MIAIKKKIVIICALLAVYPVVVLANQEYVSAEPDNNSAVAANANASAGATTANSPANSQTTKAVPNTTSPDPNTTAANNTNPVNTAVNSAATSVVNPNAAVSTTVNPNVYANTNTNSTTWNSNPAYSNNAYSNNIYTRQRTLPPLVQPMPQPIAPLPPIVRVASPLPPMPQPVAHMPSMPPLRQIANTNRVIPPPAQVQQVLPPTNPTLGTIGNGYTDVQKQAWFNSCLPAVSDKRVSSFAQEFCGCGWQHISSGELSPGLLASTLPQDTKNRGVILQTISQQCMVQIMANHKLA